jgi:hypothetical protein
LINGFTSKQGKEFSAMLTLENKKINFLFKWLTMVLYKYIMKILSKLNVI